MKFLDKYEELVGTVGLAILKVDNVKDIGAIPLYSKLLKKGGAIIVLSNQHDLGYVADDLMLEGLDYKRLLVNVPEGVSEGKLYTGGKTYISWAVNVSKSNKVDERWVFNKPEGISFHTGAFEHNTDEGLFKELLELHSNEDTVVISNKTEIVNISKEMGRPTELVEEEFDYDFKPFVKLDKGEHESIKPEKNKILYMDCFDLLANIEPESVDLVITDPPYNISIEGSEKSYGNGRHGMNFGCVTPNVQIVVLRDGKEEVVSYEELKEDEIIKTFNVENKVFEYQKLQKLNVYDIEDRVRNYRVSGELVGFTENHRHVYFEDGDVTKDLLVGTTDPVTLSGISDDLEDVDFLYRENVSYEGKVWCPTVENGTWVGVVNGVRFVTGNSWDFGFDTEKWLNYLAPTVKKGGSVVIFNSYKNIGVMVKVLKEYGYTLKGIPFWLKTNPIPHLADRRYVSSMEHAVWLVRDYGEDVDYTFNMHPNSRFKEGVFRVSQHDKQGERFHTTQKPVKLFNELIRIHSNEGDLVLDTFMGSGTTAVCSQNLGREFMGSELDENYFKLSTARVEKNARKPKLLWE